MPAGCGGGFRRVPCSSCAHGFSRYGISSLTRPPRIEGVGPLTETLKWGEPAYLTEATGSGSTIRLGRSRSSEQECAVLFNCRTTLVDDFRSRFPGVFAYEKNRAILLDAREPLPCESAVNLSRNGAHLSPPTLALSFLCDTLLVMRGFLVKAGEYSARGRRYDRNLPVRTGEGPHVVP